MLASQVCKINSNVCRNQLKNVSTANKKLKKHLTKVNKLFIQGDSQRRNQRITATQKNVSDKNCMIYNSS